MKVELTNVQVRFGSVRALEGVDVTLEPGATTVLVGPNGAGKSTLLGVLLGLVRPQQGQLRIDGQERRFGGSYREHLGYLPEDVAFAGNLTGRQVLRFFASARGVPRARIDGALEMVGLTDAARRAVRGYSRGMRQRLGLAVAVLADPDLLVMDEPTGGLDQQGLTVLWDVLRYWKERGRTVVLSTHDLALIERRADQLYVFSRGHVIAHGSPEELRDRASLPARVHVDFDDLDAARAWAARLRSHDHGEVSEDEHRVSVSVRHGGLYTVLGLVNGEGQAVTNVRVDEPGLDDVYEALLGGAP